ncbi:hypothetical protein [Chryseobacterium pennipullorum]|uniref:Uncharacterized protein n=1 Tax=Chryseobacterium pennipullorum TaxID=2258963 RepID=A0A3D9B169_9FLAO|nr:hypothetical protein [Chryseobacterium pennipullorum]REC47098.1 hypothetical protein DRF67_12865 [Chryseobacterium pennipullorum]
MEKNGKQWAILYQDFKYDEMLAFGSGYWISLSEDEGKTWKKYYTGLSGGKNYYFKQNSQKPFWRDENHLQIEADIVRMTEPSIHPLSPDYEVVKDNALVILDLSEIIKDSDEDGLTDIEERNLFLNPLSKDTDGDGIPDSEDLNPRFASSSNDFTRLYEGIIFGENTESAGLSPYEDFVIHLEQPKKVTESDKNKEEFSNELGLPNTIKLIVTNDTNLQRINPKHYKIIILTPKEFEEYRKQYHSVLEQLSYSPLFQCDKNPNVYIMSSSASFSGASYKIERTKAGWKVTTLSSWIS